MIWQNIYAFNAGEFSPRLFGRSDHEKYLQGCRKLENFIALPYGGVSNRPGTEYIAAAKSPSTAARLIPFRFSTSTNFVLELSNEAVRFFSNGAQVEVSSVSAWADTTDYVIGDQVAHNSVNYVCILAHTAEDGATPGVDDGAGDNEPGIGTDAGDYWHALTDDILELPTPYQTADLFEVQFLQVKDVVYLTHPSYDPRKLIRLADDQWSIEVTDFDRPALLDENVNSAYFLACSATTGTAKTLTATGGHTPFTADHVGAYFELSHRRADPWVRQAVSANGSSSALWCHGTTRIKTTGTWNATVSVEEQDASGNWQPIKVYDGEGDLNIEETFTQSVPAFLRITVTNYTSNTNGRSILTAEDPVQRGLVKVTAFSSSTEVTVDVIETLADTAATDLWAEGAWSAAQGFPRTLSLHEDRVWYAGTTSEPLRVWGSVTGDYENFLLGVSDTDAVDFTLASPRNNLIQWMVSQQGSLILGTSGGEFVMSSRSSETGITPTSVSVEQQSNYGSEFIQALLVNDSLVFSQRIGRKIREYFYDWERDSRQGADLTLLAEHISLGGIVQMDFAQQPVPILWCVTGNGSLIGFTYERSQNVLAWHRHITDGTFESVAVIPGTRADEVYVTVKRNINGSDVRFVERLEPYTSWYHLVSTDSNDADDTLYLFADAGKKITQAASTTVSGLSHLEGEEVAVMADGATITGLTVSSGSITLPREAEQISVGLPYTAKGETLGAVVQMESGSSQGRKLKIHRAIAYFYRTRFCGYTGFGSSAGEDDWEKFPINPDTYSQPVDLATDRIDVTVAGPSDDEPTFAWRCTEPQSCTLLSLTLKLEVEQDL